MPSYLPSAEATLVQDAFAAEYPRVLQSENVEILREHVTKFYIACIERSTALRSAFAKIDYLNKELFQQQTRVQDLHDENEQIRNEMRRFARKSTDLEERFVGWQSKLIAQAEEDRILLQKEHAAEMAKLERKVAELEEALRAEREEIRELRCSHEQPPQPAPRAPPRGGHFGQEDRLPSPSDASFSSGKSWIDLPIEPHGEGFEQPVLDMVEKRLSLQEGPEVDEESEDIKLKYMRLKAAFNDLKEENGTLHQQLMSLEEANSSMVSIKLC
ncbi:uncharacterized protein VTP21DRAFT_3890 [Calcarisporiella thermophila]|uniref:uncharacterized protein n=1 Tax=Calcarisporiella thermophila TaxID=911321 RepID=UPI0037440F44